MNPPPPQLRSPCLVRTRRSAAVRHVWPLPVTLAGVLLAGLARLSGAHWRWRHGVLEVVGGPLDAGLQHLGSAGAEALTLGHVVLARDARRLRRWRAHEWVHVRQFERWGLLMPLAYGLGSLGAMARGGCAYRNNPFELAAFDAQQQRQACRRGRSRHLPGPANQAAAGAAEAVGKSRLSTP